MRRTNTILAAAFLVALCAMGWYTLQDLEGMRDSILDAWHQREPQAGDNILTRAEFVADRAEETLNAALDREHHFIQLYGGIQRLTGQRFVEDSYSYSVIRMNNGALTFGSVGPPQADVSGNARTTVDFARRLGEMGVPFTAVITPQKLPLEEGWVPAALRNHAHEQADQFLSILAEENIHTVDLRADMEADLPDHFYRTDHHWNAQGAFLGNVLLMEQLCGEYGFEPFAPGLDRAQFSEEVYPGLFLGSQGKRVGTLYAGVDDFTLLLPDFPTAMTYRPSEAAQPRSGSMPEALYFREHLAQDYFNANPYAAFMGGDWGRAVVNNLENPDAPKVVLIRDSFGCALTPFFALQCSELTTIDLRAYGDRSLLDDPAVQGADLVVLLYNPGSLAGENMFEFS